MPTTANFPFWGNTIEGHNLVPPADNGFIEYGPSAYWEAPESQWSEWDTAQIGGLKVPGLVKVRARRACRIHKKQTPGDSGATPTSLGFDPAEIDFEITLWTPGQMQQFGVLVSSIQQRVNQGLKSRRPRRDLAFTVHHPGLAMYGINSLYFLEGTIPTSRGPGQAYTATLRFTEFYPLTTGTAPVTAKADGNFANIPSVAIRPAPPSNPPPSANPASVAP